MSRKVSQIDGNQPPNEGVGVFSQGEVVRTLARRAKSLRLARGLRQQDVADAAGISLATLRRFEDGDGGISLRSVVGVATALRAADAFLDAFPPPPPSSLDAVLAAQRTAARRPQRAPRRRP